MPKVDSIDKTSYAPLKVDIPTDLKLRLVADKVKLKKSMNETTAIALKQFYERRDAATSAA